MKAPLSRPFGIDFPVVMGHRGAPLVAPENTPASFVAAAEAGATWVELDARRSADGIVVAHDPRLPDGTALLDLSSQELRARGVWPLQQVLADLPEGLGVDVELKNLPGDDDYDEENRLAVQAAPLLRDAAAERPVLASSFNPSALEAVASAGGGVPLGLLHGSSLRAPAGLTLARELGARVLCSHVDSPGLDAVLIDAAHQHGISVLVWTVDDPSRAAALAAIGVDAICTNDPAGLVAALAS
jgi:glycerophosphoryl diester phosphodiesterase